MSTRPTEEDLIIDLVRKHEQSEKRALTKDEYDKVGEYNSRQFVNRFGGWNKAKKEAGVPRVKRNERQVTKDMIIADMKNIAENGELKQKEYKEKGNHSMQTFYDRFDGWREALEEADLESKGRAPKITEEQLKQELRKGKTLKKIAEEYGYATLNTLSQRVGEYDWAVKNKLAEPANPENSSLILSINKSDLKKAGFDPEENRLYYKKIPGDGEITLDISRDRIDD